MTLSLEPKLLQTIGQGFSKTAGMSLRREANIFMTSLMSDFTITQPPGVIVTEEHVQVHLNKGGAKSRWQKLLHRKKVTKLVKNGNVLNLEKGKHIELHTSSFLCPITCTQDCI